MSFDSHANGANSTVAVAPNPVGSGTQLSVKAGSGIKFNAPPFNCTVTNPTGEQEIVRVTTINVVNNANGDIFTIQRGAEVINGSNTPINIAVGATIVNSITAKPFTDIEQAMMDKASAQTFTGPKIGPFLDNTTYFNVKAYGAVGDGVTDDTAAFTAAIAAAAAAGSTASGNQGIGGCVLVPSGTFVTTGITLLNHVWIRGMGYKNTCLWLKAGSNNNVITAYATPDGTTGGNAYDIGVLDLMINGNYGQQTATSHGISCATNPQFTETSYENHTEAEFDVHHTIMNVRIMYCHDNGFNASGRSEMQLHNVFAFGNRGFGIAPSFDSRVTACSAGSNGLAGFYIAHGSVALTGCKSFENGTVNKGLGYGYEVTGISEVTLGACIAQNNFASGFYLFNTNAVSVQGNADSNNFGSGNGQGDFAGVELNNASQCIVDVTSGQGYQFGVGQVGNQGWALRIHGGSDQNDIRMTQFSQSSGGSQYVPLGMVSSDSVLLNNRIYINGIAGQVGV